MDARGIAWPNDQGPDGFNGVNDERAPGYYPMVRSTPDRKVRVMIVVPPLLDGTPVEPVWVVLPRRGALMWAVKVAWAAISGAWPERPKSN
jgi:hypothetical protein